MMAGLPGPISRHFDRRPTWGPAGEGGIGCFQASNESCWPSDTWVVAQVVSQVNLGNHELWLHLQEDFALEAIRLCQKAPPSKHAAQIMKNCIFGCPQLTLGRPWARLGSHFGNSTSSYMAHDKPYSTHLAGNGAGISQSEGKARKRKWWTRINENWRHLTVQRRRG